MPSTAAASPASTKGSKVPAPSNSSGTGPADEAGRLLPPGLYLLSVSLQTEFAQARQLLPLGIAY